MIVALFVDCNITEPDSDAANVVPLDFVDTILSDTISEAVSGDEVGTYRVSTGSPGGGWTDKGAVFTNTIYSNNSQTTWRLYLRTSASDPGGQNPVGWKSGGAPFMARDRSSGASLIQTLLLLKQQERVP